MKRIFVAIIMLAIAATVSAQSIARVGFYMEGGQAVCSNPQNSVTVSVTVEKEVFTPGEFARYAQKMLGVRASLVGSRCNPRQRVCSRHETLSPQ